MYDNMCIPVYTFSAAIRHAGEANVNTCNALYLTYTLFVDGKKYKTIAGRSLLWVGHCFGNSSLKL